MKLESLTSFEEESVESQVFSVEMTDGDEEMDIKQEVLLKMQPILLRVRSSEVVVDFQDGEKTYKMTIATPGQQIMLRPTLALSHVRVKTLNISASVVESSDAKGSVSRLMET